MIKIKSKNMGILNIWVAKRSGKVGANCGANWQSRELTKWRTANGP